MLLKIIKFTKNSSFDNLTRFFELSINFKYRNQFELLVLTLEIELSRLSNQVNTNCQHLSRIFDSNLITQSDAISLAKIDL